MNYYQIIFNLSDQKDVLDFEHSKNYTDFELKKLNFDTEFLFDRPIIFNVDTSGGYGEVDFNLSNSGIIIVSQKFKHVFEKFEGLRLNFYPIEVPDYKLKQDYYALEFLDYIDCVDENKSEYKIWTIDNCFVESHKSKIGKYYSSLSEIVIDTSKTEKKDFFRLKKYNSVIIASDNFKKLFQENRLTGVIFKELQNTHNN